MNAKQQAAAVAIELAMRGAEMACGAKMYTGEDIRRLKRIATGFEGALSNLSIELAAMGVELADNPHAHTPKDFRNLKLVYKAEWEITPEHEFAMRLFHLNAELVAQALEVNVYGQKRTAGQLRHLLADFHLTTSHTNELFQGE